jgi:hypothetical protein
MSVAEHYVYTRKEGCGPLDLVGRLCLAVVQHQEQRQQNGIAGRQDEDAVPEGEVAANLQRAHFADGAVLAQFGAERSLLHHRADAGHGGCLCVHFVRFLSGESEFYVDGGIGLYCVVQPYVHSSAT